MTAGRRRWFEAMLRAEHDRLTETLANERVATVDVDEMALEAHEVVELEKVDRALQLIEEHPTRYGMCEICHTRIPIARMELVPTTLRCERHADAVPTG